MKLYHCTNTYFEEIDLNKSKPNKDFGKAFYLSANSSEVEPIGKAKVLLEGGEKTMLTFDFDENHLSDGSLKVKIFEGYSEEWVEFIFANRDFKQEFLFLNSWKN